MAQHHTYDETRFVMNRFSLIALPLFVAVLLLMRSSLPTLVPSGTIQYVGLPLVAWFLWNLRIATVRCPRWLLVVALLLVGGVAGVRFFLNASDRSRPVALLIAQFDGDALGAATRRFTEQITIQFRRNRLADDQPLSFAPLEAGPVEWGKPGAPLVTVGGTERWLQVGMPPAQHGSLTDVAHSSLSPFLPPLKLWGGGVPFGVSVDQHGATAEFLALLVWGLSTEDERGDLSLIDAGKLVGQWTSSMHKGVPLLLVAERQIRRAVAGPIVERSYLHCAGKNLAHALSLGDFSRDRALEAALRNNYAVVLWLRWMHTTRREYKHRAIALWRSVATSKKLSLEDRSPAVGNLHWASRFTTKKTKGTRGKAMGLRSSLKKGEKTKKEKRKQVTSSLKDRPPRNPLLKKKTPNEEKLIEPQT